MDDSLLCELVGQHPSLYDPKNKQYKDQNVKDNVWKEIAGVLEQSIDECKKRWRNIRDTYNRRKRTGKLGTGSSRSAKVPKWYLTEVLSFLSNVENERQSTSNVASEDLLDNSGSVNDQNETEDTNQSQNQETFEEDFIEDSFSESVANIQEESDSGSVNLQKRKERKPLLNCSKRQKITEQVFDIFKRNSNARAERHAKLMNTIQTPNVEEHPIDSFFRSMAGSVKKLSQASQITAKMEICRIVGELELKELQQSSSDTTTITSQFSRPSTSLSQHSLSSPEILKNTQEPLTGRIYNASQSHPCQQQITNSSRHSLSSQESPASTWESQQYTYSTESDLTFVNLK